MKIQLINAGCYTQRQYYRQIPECVFIMLVVSGVEYFRVSDPSGSSLGTLGNFALAIIPEGFAIDFGFSEKRENFTISCRLPELHWDSTGQLSLPYEEASLLFPWHIVLAPEKCAHLREIFSRITSLFAAAMPAERFAAEQLTRSILSEFVLARQSEQSRKPDAAERFKAAIDSDKEFRSNLQELSQKCGLSLGHLRKCFTCRYRVEPGEYRARLRLNQIFRLLGESDLTLKEVADAVGMKNVTHLCMFLKARCDMTPGQLRKQYRSALPGGNEEEKTQETFL